MCSLQALANMLGGEGSANVAWEVVHGEIFSERRLHHLLLQVRHNTRIHARRLQRAHCIKTHMAFFLVPDVNSYHYLGTHVPADVQLM